MKIFKHSIKIIAIALFATLLSCGDRYPDLEDGLYAEFVTSMDTMVVKLHYDKTPVTVANFVLLAEGNHPMVDSVFKGKKFYNGLLFHRVMNNFMIQGGDPTATGSGSPGYRFGDEFDETLKHDKPGILSMANSGPNTNGSQFFITEKETPWLDNIHTIFGEVVLGLDVQDSISNVKVGPGNRPIKDVVIKEVNIIRKGYDARNFDALKTWETELPKLEERAKQKAEEARKKAEEARKKAEEKVNAAAAETLLILNDYKSKAKAYASGLMSYTITKGNGSKPKQGNTVKVYYEGYFIDGKLFDSNRKEIEEKYGKLNPQKEQRGMYNPMPMQISPDAQMIAGFKEGVASMHEGDKAYFYIPSHLAYGENGRPPIKPNTDLIFIIEMVEIVK
ncbi:Peptidyl-prolyl cis-trans isomerase [hydrothermal vent metagenome]|uniref:peptidylprolyl isomerase n=1 Tax=hydrothermal vent metagenome TaxID=652676 RepID=A0A3B0RAL6_9ZZZZ